jgi:hypothetical protein
MSQIVRVRAAVLFCVVMSATSNIKRGWPEV